MGNQNSNSYSGKFKNEKNYKCKGYILNHKTSDKKITHIIEGNVKIYIENNNLKEKLKI